MEKQEQAKHREKMIRLIKQWQSSGESKVRFCQIHNIPKWQFYYWTAKYEKEKSSQAGFIPVQIKEESKTEKILDRIEIRYSNGTSVHLPAEVSLVLIKSLVCL
jgi:transposase-like protein